MGILSTKSKDPDEEGMIDRVRLPGGRRWKDSEHRRKAGHMEAKFVCSRAGKGGSSYSCCYFLGGSCRTGQIEKEVKIEKGSRSGTQLDRSRHVRC